MSAQEGVGGREVENSKSSPAQSPPPKHNPDAQRNPSEEADSIGRKVCPEIGQERNVLFGGNRPLESHREKGRSLAANPGQMEPNCRRIQNSFSIPNSETFSPEIQFARRSRHHGPPFPAC